MTNEYIVTRNNFMQQLAFLFLFLKPFFNFKQVSFNLIPNSRSALNALGGIFHVPDHLSSKAADLISAMLSVDPIKRATIKQIR